MYNLGRDLSETTNLATTEPEKRAELSTLLTERQREIEAIAPEVNPDYEPWPERERRGHFADEMSGMDPEDSRVCDRFRQGH